MHLKSSNGPVDVLVCPEGDEQRPASPCTSMDSEHMTSTPVKTLPYQPNFHPPTMPASQELALQLQPEDDLDISLSSTVDAGGGEEFQGLQYSPEDLQSLDTNTLLNAPTDMYSFQCLSPSLQDEDFCFGLDGAEGITDLFDLV